MGGRETLLKNIDTALVTGGGGFVGKAVVRLLLENNVKCRVIGRNRYPDIESLGVDCRVGDIRDRQAVIRASKGVDCVFHVAALAGIWGKWKTYYDINVVGTENVLEGCRKNGVPYLVYTSTPSVVFSKKNIAGEDESLPYATRFLCHYARSKVLAEKMVLMANNQLVKSCAIRPHLIWGPGDPHLVPRLIESGRKRKLAIVGSGKNLVDITFIENVAHAHVLAAENLSTSATSGGKAYFIGQEKPVALWEWINTLFMELGIPPVEKKVSFTVARRLGAVYEMMYTLFRLQGEPRMTRFLAYQLAHSHYFSHENAEKDLNYRPIVSLEEGMKMLVAWAKALL
ncbi:3-beta hydroxysteroid dehydrogenase [Desulfomarina profundi]|uniref:3-beta hydroxysteroid dehydrogenase n=1 Tax=Desulfomarina profundi TaxID=2772557 RepID=A0A8D5JDB9_9BACT|nr:NAD-dependent epimerase/dehydratase family protein [Desulfomarina profundi]BCL60873.1 3-beta hydroxysteroid dehydrogenase [Desulfomarina profundi]